MANCLQIKNNIFIERIGALSILTYYTFYVISNSDWIYSKEIILVKHFLFILISIISAINNPRESIKSTLILLPISLIYMIGENYTYFLMSIVFSAAIPLISKNIEDILINRNWNFILLLFFISSIPAFIEIQTIIQNGLFVEIRYGRPRMLLGYFHPKEAAICFGVPIILSLIIAKRKLEIVCLGVIFIFLVGSRNVSILIIVMYLVIAFRKKFLFLILTAISGLISWVCIDKNALEKIDILSSLRISLWSDVILNPISIKDIDFFKNERFNIDSFYIETIIHAGPYSILILVLYFSVIFYFLCVNKNLLSIAAFFGLLCFSFFDSGIVSTGNTMHIFLWSLIMIGFIDTEFKNKINTI